MADIFHKRFEALISISGAGKKIAVMEGRFSSQEIATLLKQAVSASLGIELPEFVTVSFTPDSSAPSGGVLQEYKLTLQWPHAAPMDLYKVRKPAAK